MILLDESDHLSQRKLMLPAFHGEKMQRLAAHHAGGRRAGGRRRGRPDSRIELHPRFQALTLEVILRAVFGLDAGPHLDGLRARLNELLAITAKPATLIPFLQRGKEWARVRAHRGRRRTP